MSSRTASRGWALALLALTSVVAIPAWAGPGDCNANPSADINPDNLTVAEGSLVTLNGLSSNPRNGDLGFSWTLLSKSSPSLPNVTLSGANTGTPSFTAPDVPVGGGSYTFRLTVFCNANNPNNPKTDTEDTIVNITNTNSPPHAAATVDPVNPTEGQIVTLDGSISSDIDGQPLTYNWVQTGGSPTVALTNANSAVATFVAPNVLATTTLSFTLTVSDGTAGDSTTKQVSVVFTNDPPVARLTCPAGGVLTVNEGQSVTFDASGSTDFEGSPLLYSWSQNMGLPDLGIGLLVTPSITFNAPHLGYNQNGVMTVRVTVTEADHLNVSTTTTCGLIILDKTAPVIDIPDDIVEEATSSAGANVNYEVTTQDAVDDDQPYPLACMPPSGSLFALDEITIVHCTDKDSAGNIANAMFGVSVIDTTAPVITLPIDFGVEATSPDGAIANYPVSALDIVDGSVTPVCDHAPGSLFQLGHTTATCTATDAHDNASQQSIVVNVFDTTAPVIAAHDNLTVEATKPQGADVTYTAPTWTDAVDVGGTANCLPASGSTFALGTTTVHCRAQDAAGNKATSSFTIEVLDRTAPELTVPANILAEATSAAGAVVTFTPTATDAVDTDVEIVCTPASGSTFAIGTKQVDCTATDNFGNHDDDSFDVTVQDTTPPELTVPANILAEATSAAGAVVTFTPTATDAVDDDVEIVCTPASGSTFSIKTTQVDCTATDNYGNHDDASFSVTVQDTTAPELTVPANILREATSPAGAVVTFTTSATDAVDADVQIVCTPASGSTFGITTTQVNCTATDDYGNHDDEHFNVTVQDTTAPDLTVPSDIVREATSPAGAIVTFSPSATDIVDQDVTIVCTPASGSTFGITTTQVDCIATDDHGNHSEDSFNVTVRDTTAPTLVLPADITREATGPSGAVVTWTATANDIVSGSVPVTCVAPSGSTFGLAPPPTKANTTAVNCSASDGAGNTANGSFNVTVKDTTAPAITSHDDVTVHPTGGNSAIATWTDPTASDTVSGSTTVTCAPLSGSSFTVLGGPKLVTCSTKDARENASSTTFYVNVTYDKSGFFSPVDNLPVINTVNAGQAIPVKFGLGGNQGLAIFEAGYPRSVAIGCTATLIDPIEETMTAGNSSLTYDTGTQRYHYVWKTEKGWAGTCRQLQLKFIDGSTMTANFNFKK